MRFDMDVVVKSVVNRITMTVIDRKMAETTKLMREVQKTIKKRRPKCR